MFLGTDGKTRPVFMAALFKETEIGLLRALFVGGLGQRKEIADLFDAVNLLKAIAELTIVGRPVGASRHALDAALGNHRWIESLPREQILAEMRQHDVLVFPSLFEGFWSGGH